MNSRLVLAGRYELRHRLGQEAMWAVWRARDLVLDRDVAVKVLAADRGELLREGVRSEALAAATLAHADSAGVFENGVPEVESGLRIPFVAMELLRVRPLSGATAQVAPRAAFQICAEIASALAAAHAQGVVHRDARPGNVLLTGSGAKVFDFGVAATVAIDDDRPIDEFGAPTNVAPEQLTGAEATSATDVYALGVLLYGLLTCDPHMIDGIPANVATLCRRCLATDPAQRPSASDVADALAEAAHAAPLESRDSQSALLCADTVPMAPGGIETTLMWTGRQAPRRLPWLPLAMIMLAGLAALALVAWVGR